jgi:hypothetical protein
VPVSKKPRKEKTPASARQARSDQPVILPDRRAMESFLSAFSPRQADANLRKAQDIMYDAWETANRHTRLFLAKRALKVSPLCADAYVLLAEEGAKDLEEARDLYARGVEAGALAIGPETFEDDVGHFWGVLETRPYMRARSGLAQTLWLLGEKEDAKAPLRLPIARHNRMPRPDANPPLGRQISNYDFRCWDRASARPRSHQDLESFPF